MRIVIIGNGVAGIEAALTVRAREPAWDVTIVSEESDHFFSRTALMWVASGQLSHACIEPHERDLYARMGFTRVRARALAVEPDARRVVLAGDHAPLAYDRLLLACGSRPRPGPWPGAALDGVGHFVTMQDLEWLEAELHGGPSHAGGPPRAEEHYAPGRPTRRGRRLATGAEGSPYLRRPNRFAERGGPPAHPVVIGGGLIGIEAAEVMVAAGLRPRFFIREEWFWPMALDAREGAWITERMREHGVDVHLEEEVEAIEGDAHVERVRANGASHPCDLCVIAIGVVPNTAWLDGAVERDASGGLVVDETLMSSAEGVFAAGDCASVPTAEGRRVEQLWYTARDQGRVAGRRLCGDTTAYARPHVYNSAKLFDIEYTTAGRVADGDGESFFFEEGGAVRSTTRVVHHGGAVVGFNLLGRRWDHSVLLRWIDERRSLAHVLAHLGEASFDTELVPPLRVPADAVPRDAAPTNAGAA